jgi:hypothetical protein
MRPKGSAAELQARRLLAGQLLLEGGYEHEPLPPVAQRRLTMLHPNLEAVDLDKLLQSARLDDRLPNTFDTREDTDRCEIAGCYVGTHPFWIDVPATKGGHPGNTSPGRRGILAVHAQSETVPCFIVRKVALSANTPCSLRLVVSGDPYEQPGKSDFVLTAGVHDGQAVHWFASVTVQAGQPPADKNWQTLEYSLNPYAGRTVGLVAKVAYGGPHGVCNEEAFFDEISVIPQTP